MSPEDARVAYAGIVNRTPMVIVCAGNRTHSRFSDLASPAFESFIAIQHHPAGTMVIAAIYGSDWSRQKSVMGGLTPGRASVVAANWKERCCHPRIGARRAHSVRTNEGDALITMRWKLADEGKETGDGDRHPAVTILCDIRRLVDHLLTPSSMR